MKASMSSTVMVSRMVGFLVSVTFVLNLKIPRYIRVQWSLRRENRKKGELALDVQASFLDVAKALLNVLAHGLQLGQDFPQ